MNIKAGKFYRTWDGKKAQIYMIHDRGRYPVHGVSGGKMKETPIIFSGEMARAILDGRKTQTRRLVKNQGRLKVVHGWNGRYLQPNMIFEAGRLGITSPYTPGDRLWVREAWGESKVRDQSIDDKIVLVHHAWRYKADAEVEQVQVFGRRDLKTKAELYKWKSPIFMPKEASRITLEITNVRIEQLHDISEEDAKAEGVSLGSVGDLTTIPESWIKGGWMPSMTATSFQAGFGVKWQEINGKKHPWESNPWVWAISFKRIENDEQ